MKNDAGKIIETVAGKQLIIANNEEYLATVSLTYGTVNFFSYGRNGICVDHCFSYSVSKKRYLAVLKKADSKDETVLDKALHRVFYKMPGVLRGLVIKAYLQGFLS